MKPLVIFGGSGHARVIIDAARCSRRYELIAVFAPDLKPGTVIGGVPVRDESVDLPTLLREHPLLQAVVGIGDNQVRERVAAKLTRSWPGLSFCAVVHPSAIIAEGVSIGPGAFVSAGAIINCGARIGAHAVVNTGAVVEHDVVLADYAFLGPKVALAGNVQVGHGAMVGIGTSVIQGKRIGARCVVGAGATVISDLPEGVTAVGVPAHVIKNGA